MRREIDYSDNESKRLALDALDIKVYATRFSINIQGIIPADLATTARTWGCKFSYAYNYSTDDAKLTAGIIAHKRRKQ